MKKVKYLRYSFQGNTAPKDDRLEKEVNKFLENDGKEINVLDIKFQVDGGNIMVLVYYEEIGTVE